MSDGRLTWNHCENTALSDSLERLLETEYLQSAIGEIPASDIIHKLTTARLIDSEIHLSPLGIDAIIQCISPLNLNNGIYFRITIHRDTINVLAIVHTIAKYFNVEIDDMLGHNRSFRTFKPRIAAMYLARMHTSHSLPKLGKIFGGRNHSTILRAISRCEQFAEADPVWAARLDALNILVQGRILEIHDGEREYEAHSVLTPPSPQALYADP